MSIPDDLDELVGKLLAKEPKDRYQSADELRDFVTRIRKSLSESTARSIGLSIGRSIPQSGTHAAASPAGVPAEAHAGATPQSAATPKAPVAPPLETRITPQTSEVPKGEAKKLPPEMVAATMAVPEGLRPKPPQQPRSSRGLVLGVVGLLLGLAALAVAYLNRPQPVVVQVPPTPVKPVEPAQPPPEPVKVEPAPPPEPQKVEAPSPAPAPEPTKVEPPPVPAPAPAKKDPAPLKVAPKPAPKEDPAPPKVAPKPAAKGDKLLARFIALEKQSEAKPDALSTVDKKILGKYLEALKAGTVKPEQRDQAEGFANKIEADLKGQ